MTSCFKRAVYDRTSGYCHLCHRKLSFLNHGKLGRKGAWHVEHHRPRALGGTDDIGNLYPACIDCNLEKGTRSTRTVRAWNGKKRAPLCREKRIEAKESQAAMGGFLLGGCGFVIGKNISSNPLWSIGLGLLGLVVGCKWGY